MADPIIVHVLGGVCTNVQRGSTPLYEPDAVIVDWDTMHDLSKGEMLELKEKVYKHLSPGDREEFDALLHDEQPDPNEDDDDGTDEFGSDEDEREGD